jgi:hypothetical protein
VQKLSCRNRQIGRSGWIADFRQSRGERLGRAERGPQTLVGKKIHTGLEWTSGRADGRRANLVISVSGLQERIFSRRFPCANSETRLLGCWFYAEKNVLYSSKGETCRSSYGERQRWRFGEVIQQQATYADLNSVEGE